ncbi:MAG: hypothetical protein ACK4ZJ_16530 [Allorhizobium sp.]
MGQSELGRRVRQWYAEPAAPRPSPDQRAAQPPLLRVIGSGEGVTVLSSPAAADSVHAIDPLRMRKDVAHRMCPFTTPLTAPQNAAGSAGTAANCQCR